MIRAWLYTEGEEHGRPVDPGTLADVASDSDTLLWVDVETPTEDEVRHLKTTLGIHHVTAEDLLHGGQRTKLERIGDHFHIAAHDCSLKGTDLVTREVDLVFSQGWLVSVRHGSEARTDERAAEPPLPIEDAQRRFERSRVEHGSNDEGFLLWALLDVIVDRWFDVTDSIDDCLAESEVVVFEDNAAGIPRELFELRRALVAFRRNAAPLREVVSALLRREAECIGEQALVHLQDVFDHVLRVMDLVESQRELLTGLLEGRLAVMSNQMNQVMKATSSWGAILIVATLVAGIYGMNFRHMPELSWYFGYPFALGTMAVATGALYLVFKRRDWL